MLKCCLVLRVCWCSRRKLLSCEFDRWKKVLGGDILRRRLSEDVTDDFDQM